ncbi:hypothetical protein [Tropicimonas marinistellae]|uniref:hypothetical protein n=1 Tax=Tropicimonas marinistellae TaxID=1739787 RepID=UPI00082D756B|nr:hypothetical protein [Tropicimonas marinistellae]
MTALDLDETQARDPRPSNPCQSCLPAARTRALHPAARPDGAPPHRRGTGTAGTGGGPDADLSRTGVSFFADRAAVDLVADALLEDCDGGARSDTNLVNLHPSYQMLRRCYENRSTRDELFDSETVTIIESVMTPFPGLTPADENVQTLLSDSAKRWKAG